MSTLGSVKTVMNNFLLLSFIMTMTFIEEKLSCDYLIIQKIFLRLFDYKNN